MVNYLQIVDAERTLLNNRLSAAQALNQRLASTVVLIKSLGGGWEAPTAGGREHFHPGASLPFRASILPHAQSFPRAFYDPRDLSK